MKRLNSFLFLAEIRSWHEAISTTKLLISGKVGKDLYRPMLEQSHEKYRDLEEPMSIAFVDREPEKHEIERLRQLLGRYDQETLPSLLFQIHSPLREIIAEAFEISSDLLCDFPNENPEGNLDYKIVLNPRIHFGAAKEMRYPFTAYWEYLSRFNVNMENYRDNPTAVGVASVDLL